MCAEDGEKRGRDERDQPADEVLPDVDLLVWCRVRRGHSEPAAREQRALGGLQSGDEGGRREGVGVQEIREKTGDHGCEGGQKEGKDVNGS